MNQGDPKENKPRLTRTEADQIKPEIAAGTEDSRFGGLNMHHFKARILALVLIVISIGLIYYNWHQLQQEGRYSTKLAAFGPVIGIGGIFLLLFPSMGGKPTTTRKKILVLIVLAIGLVAGLINWYLMDPGFFGR